MKGITHIVFSVFLSSLYLYYFNPDVMGLFFISISIVMALIPDIDESRSTLGKRIWPISLLLRHRGFVHSLIFLCAVLIILGYFAPGWAVIAAAIGFISHLVLDSLTPAGIRPFWPSKIKISGYFKTGGIIDYGLLFIFVLFCIALVPGVLF